MTFTNVERCRPISTTASSRVPAPLPTFASVGLEQEAARIAGIATDAHDYLAAMLDRRPDAEVFVLDERDWATKGRFPLFGLPNAYDGLLVVAGTEAPFWADLVTMVEPADRAEIDRVYVHARRPAALPTMLTLPRLAARSAPEAWEYRTIEDFERGYTEMTGPNYVWFQFRLELLAEDILGSGGEGVVRQLFEAFRTDGGRPPRDLADIHPLLGTVANRFGRVERS